jgi:hypothetical protein
MPAIEKSDAATMFNVIDASLKEHSLSWDKCRSYASDNANSMVGSKNSVVSRIKEKQPLVCPVGCPCHLAALTAQKGAKALTYSVEDFFTDIYYHLDKSVKRKAELREFMEFTSVEINKVIKHASTRWLSLGKVTDRTIKAFTGIKSYFNSNYDEVSMKH